MSATSVPLVPADVDLRDMPYMPVDIVRLFGSEFHAVSDDAAWRAGVTLWLKSYHQVPASSIPDDDIALARLAEFGRDVKAWVKVKAAALRGWRKCSDGRLYHPVVAEKALEAWFERLNQRKSSRAGNAKRYGQEFDPAELDEQLEECCRHLARLNPHSRTLNKRGAKTAAPASSVVPPGGAEPPTGSPGGTPDGTPESLPSGSQAKLSEAKLSYVESLPAAAVPQSREPPPQPPPDSRDPDGLEAECRALVGTEPCLASLDFHAVRRLLDEGSAVIRADVVEGIRIALGKANPSYRFRSWQNFENWIRNAARDRLAQAGPRVRGGSSGGLTTMANAARTVMDELLALEATGAPH